MEREMELMIINREIKLKEEIDKDKNMIFVLLFLK